MKRRKETWYEDENLREQVIELKRTIQDAERRYHSTIAKSVLQGVESVRKYVTEQGIPGVYGQLSFNVNICNNDTLTIRSNH